MTWETKKIPVYWTLTYTNGNWIAGGEIAENPWENFSIISRRVQETWLRVVEEVINIYYQWEPWAYSHGVAKLMYDQLTISEASQDRIEVLEREKVKVRYKIWEIIGLENFPLVHTKIKKGHIGVLPVGNTIAGPVWENINYFYNTPGIKVIAGRYERIRHMLMGLPGIDVQGVKEVISHPQALAQCENSIEALGYMAENFWDTAGAAKEIKEKWLKTKLAVASQDAADRYGLEIYQRDMQDNPKNRTKFFVMANEDTPVECLKSPNITIINLHVAEGSGSLDTFLNVLAIFWVNSTEIHSSVVKGNHEDLSYNIFLEIEGTVEEEKVKLALLATSNGVIRSMITNPKIAHIASYLGDGNTYEGLKILWKWNVANALSALENSQIQAFIQQRTVRTISENMKTTVEELQALIQQVNGHGDTLEIGTDLSIVGTYYYNQFKEEEPSV